MALPTSVTTTKNTIPSYLYFQYLDDTNLPSFISAYNQSTQAYLDWFNNANLPIYTQLSGSLLDWVGAGIYGQPRPNFSYLVIAPLVGTVAGAAISSTYKDSMQTTPLGLTTSASPTTIVNITVNDDIYKRVLTWNFYKGDGMQWSIPWFKRRIHRFLNGPDGIDMPIAFTQDVSVDFVVGSNPQQVNVNIYTSDLDTGHIFAGALEYGVLQVPFRFKFVVLVSELPRLHLDNALTPLDQSILS